MWELIKAPDRIVAEVPIWKCYGLHFKEAFRHPLPFYDNAYLVKAVYEEDEYVGISAGEHVFWLDGTSRPIHAANRALGLKLTDKNVAEYACFFCFHIRNGRGRPLHLEAVIDGVRRAGNGWMVKGIMNCDGDLYEVDISVTPDGSVIATENQKELASCGKQSKIRSDISMLSNPKQNTALLNAPGSNPCRFTRKVFLPR
jgi:hypothetical protein